MDGGGKGSNEAVPSRNAAGSGKLIAKELQRLKEDVARRGHPERGGDRSEGDVKNALTQSEDWHQ